MSESEELDNEIVKETDRNFPSATHQKDFLLNSTQPSWLLYQDEATLLEEDENENDIDLSADRYSDAPHQTEKETIQPPFSFIDASIESQTTITSSSQEDDTQKDPNFSSPTHTQSESTL